jgi:hypothetical protein
MGALIWINRRDLRLTLPAHHGLARAGRELPRRLHPGSGTTNALRLHVGVETTRPQKKTGLSAGP